MIFPIFVLQYNISQKEQLWCNCSQEVMSKCHTSKKAVHSGIYDMFYFSLMLAMVLWKVIDAGGCWIFQTPLTLLSYQLLLCPVHYEVYFCRSNKRLEKRTFPMHISPPHNELLIQKKTENRKHLLLALLLGLTFSSVAFQITKAHVWKGVQGPP
jgi:hypothetical protein